jgi:hypothetical protein
MNYLPDELNESGICTYEDEDSTHITGHITKSDARFKKRDPGRRGRNEHVTKEKLRSRYKQKKPQKNRERRAE